MRVNTVRRNSFDLERIILNYLTKMGSGSTTELMNIVNGNYYQAKICLTHLLGAGLIEAISMKNFRMLRSSRGRIARMDRHVKSIFMITEQGRQYLEKANELELLLVDQRSK